MIDYKFLIGAVILTGLFCQPAVANPVESEYMPMQVIYVIRHAEKADTADNPELNAQGKQRAERLAEMLRNAGVEMIASTRYARTQQTAEPLAKWLDIPIETYNAGDADAIIKKVRDAGKTALIVGHSNTVPNIVQAAGGHAPELTEKDYGDLFQLVISAQGTVTNRLYVDGN